MSYLIFDWFSTTSKSFARKMQKIFTSLSKWMLLNCLDFTRLYEMKQRTKPAFIQNVSSPTRFIRTCLFLKRIFFSFPNSFERRKNNFFFWKSDVQDLRVMQIRQSEKDFALKSKRIHLIYRCGKKQLSYANYVEKNWENSISTQTEERCKVAKLK